MLKASDSVKSTMYMCVCIHFLLYLKFPKGGREVGAPMIRFYKVKWLNFNIMEGENVADQNQIILSNFILFGNHSLASPVSDLKFCWLSKSYNALIIDHYFSSTQKLRLPSDMI